MATIEAPRAVSGPALWYGPEMARRTDWLRHLTPDEVAALDAASARLAESGIDIASIGPADLAAPCLAPLAAELRDAVLRGRGFILLRGMPVECWSPRQCAVAYVGLGAMLGEPVSQNAMGHILGHVKDIGAEYERPTHRGYQTAARLPYHCDSSDVVGLLCRQPAKSGGKSSLVSSWALYNEMASRPPDLLPELL